MEAESSFSSYQSKNDSFLVFAFEISQSNFRLIIDAIRVRLSIKANTYIDPITNNAKI